MIINNRYCNENKACFMICEAERSHYEIIFIKLYTTHKNTIHTLSLDNYSYDFLQM